MWVFKKLPLMMNSRKLNKRFESFENEFWIRKDDICIEYFLCEVLNMLNNIWVDFLVLKWWVALSLFYWSRRFSNDLDLDLVFSISYWQKEWIWSSNFNNDDEKELKKEVIKKAITFFQKQEIARLKWNKIKYQSKFTSSTIEMITNFWWITKDKWETLQDYINKLENLDVNKITHATWLFIIENWTFWKSYSIVADYSFRTFNHFEEIELSKNKKELYLIDNLKYRCLWRSDIFCDKLNTLWERFKFNDLYDVKFLLDNDIKFKFSDIIEELLKSNRKWKENKFKLWIEDKSEIRKIDPREIKNNLLWILDKLKKWEIFYLKNWKYERYWEEELKNSIDHTNKKLIFSDKIFNKEWIENFFNDFYIKVEKEFFNRILLEDEDEWIWDINENNKFSDLVWEDNLDFLDEINEETKINIKNKLMNFNLIKESFNYWNKEWDINFKIYLLNEVELLIDKNNMKYVLVFLNEIKEFDLKEDLLEYLFLNKDSLLDMQILNKLKNEINSSLLNKWNL